MMKGGEFDDALRLYREAGAFLSAGDLLLRMGEEELAVAEYRAEAVYLANSLISQMWADDRNTLKANYDSTVGGPKYTQFQTDVQNGMLGAIFPSPPIVKVDTADLPTAVTKTSSVVQVQISWQLPGESTPHNYITTGVIGQN